MNTFSADSASPVWGSTPRRLLSQGGSIPGASLGSEFGAPAPPASQPMPRLDTNMLVILAALICALVAAVGFFSMLRCALQCTRGAFRSSEAAATRRCNTGMKKAAIDALPTLIYRKDLQPPEAGTDCPICLADFQDGEKLRALPHCNHCFHMECVDRWFRTHSSCPTCRNCLLSQAKAKAAAPSSNPQQSVQVCESSGMQIPPAECLVQVASPARQGDRDSESLKDDRPGMGCWNPGKPRCDTACDIGQRGWSH